MGRGNVSKSPELIRTCKQPYTDYYPDINLEGWIPDQKIKKGEITNNFYGYTYNFLVDICIFSYKCDLGDLMVEFEDLIEELDKLGEKERSKEIERVAKECVCPHCPSYNECADKKFEYAFCITGKSEGCIDTELGCLCPTCPLAQEYQIGVMYNFYCIRGSEKEQKS